MNQEEFKEKVYEDHHGYLRWRDSKKLVHRTIAYNEIYLKNRKKYSISFSEYQIDHKDGNKKNNRIDNLDLIPIREHELKHNIFRYEYQLIETYFIFAAIGIIWFGYLGWASGYKYNTHDVIFMVSTLVIGIILVYLANKKKKGIRYV